jgi:hypothetical protein
METKLDLSHLARETKTALELAIVALAPAQLVRQLAEAAGMLDALAELPDDAPPIIALIPKTVGRARSGLKAWNAWAEKHAERISRA